MSLLQHVAERIDRLEAAWRTPMVANNFFSDTGKEHYGDDGIWIEALDKGRIRFVDGPESHPSFHIPDFRKINFSGAELDHQEWRAQINRFYWARPLTLEYLRTRDLKYARILRDTIEAWLDYHQGNTYREYGDIGSVDSTLNISVRLGQKKYQG